MSNPTKHEIAMVATTMTNQLRKAHKRDTEKLAQSAWTPSSPVDCKGPIRFPDGHLYEQVKPKRD